MLTHCDSDVKCPTKVQQSASLKKQNKTANPATTDIVEFPNSCVAKNNNS